MIRALIIWLCGFGLFQPVFSQPNAEFENRSVDFGTVIEGTVCKYSFKFKNTGNKPLLISNVSVTCGCTVPRWSNEAIQPGDTSSVYIEFNTFNKMGSVSKGVNLTTNCPEPMIGLIISANIIPDPAFVPLVDSTHYKPLRLVDQKAFYQVMIPVHGMKSKGFTGDSPDLENMIKKILYARNRSLTENVWYTSTPDQVVINTFLKENKVLLAQILSRELSKKKRVRYWMKKIKTEG